MKLPPTSNKTTREQFDMDVNEILETAMGGSVDQKMEAVTTIIQPSVLRTRKKINRK